MKYYKLLLLMLLFVLFGIVAFYGFSEGLTALFTFPIFAVGVFLTFYLSKEFELDEKERLKKTMQATKEDVEAEHWVETTLVPDTLRYMKIRRWTIIVYCILFFSLTAFTWSYLSHGLLVAIKDFAYAGMLLWVLLMYVLIVPSVYDRIEKHFPKNVQNLVRGDWTRGYAFLFPITFLIYLLYPFEEIATKFFEKALTFPLFFIVYTFAFVCLYCISYMYQSIQREEKQRLHESIKKEVMR